MATTGWGNGLWIVQYQAFISNKYDPSWIMPLRTIISEVSMKVQTFRREDERLNVDHFFQASMCYNGTMLPPYIDIKLYAFNIILYKGCVYLDVSFTIIDHLWLGYGSIIASMFSMRLKY